MDGLLERLTTKDYEVTDVDRLRQLRDEYAAEVAASVERQYIKSDQAPRDLRASALGKPAVLQALAMPKIQSELFDLGYYTTANFSETLTTICHQGDIFESKFKFDLQRYGFVLEQPGEGHHQHEVMFEGVAGHLDIIAQRDGERYLLECKTMNDWYFKQFLKNPDDSKGYLTQLSVYAHCTGLTDSAYWVCQNRATLEVGIVKLNPDRIQPCLERARTVINAIRKINCLADFDGNITAPPGEPEIFKKQPTGRLLVPMSMRYSPYVRMFYEIETEPNGYKKPTLYCGYVDEQGKPHTRRRRMTDVVKQLRGE